MSHEPPCTAELEQRRLLLLNGYVDGTHAFVRDGKCAYCGIHAVAEIPLCVVCEERRQRLTLRYPDISIGNMRHIAEASREWSPHNSE